MKQFLLKFSFFRNWAYEIWEDGWEQGENWNQSGGVGIPFDPPKNPYL